MEAVWDDEDSFAFVHGSLQVLFSLAGPQFHDDEHGETARGHVAHCAAGWAFQPGWSHGQVPLEQETARMRSSSIALPPDQFLKAVERVTAAGLPQLFDEPAGWATGRSPFKTRMARPWNLPIPRPEKTHGTRDWPRGNTHRHTRLRATVANPLPRCDWLNNTHFSAFGPA